MVARPAVDSDVVTEFHCQVNCSSCKVFYFFLWLLVGAEVRRLSAIIQIELRSIWSTDRAPAPARVRDHPMSSLVGRWWPSQGFAVPMQLCWYINILAESSKGQKLISLSCKDSSRMFASTTVICICNLQASKAVKSERWRTAQITPIASVCSRLPCWKGQRTTSVYRNWALEMFAVQAMVTCDFFELVGLLNALAS